MDRRKFLQVAGLGAAAAAAFPASGAILGETFGQKADEAAATGKKLRIAMAGTGNRGTFWIKQMLADCPDVVDLVGMMDKNPGRVETSKKHSGAACPTFTDLDAMIRQTKPDYLFVCTMDSTHHEQIIRAMELGVDIITEKPMTTDEGKCQAIIDAQRKTGRNIVMAFNYRYAAHRTKIWELIHAGRIGEVTSVDFHWYLDIKHGADYFRRWHRRREFGGSLWLHKASHHFDLLNWWLDAEPEEVFAFGALDFYGRNGKLRADNCRVCPHTKECRFFWDMTKAKTSMELYADNEKYDGYKRDGCVFKQDVDIFDKMCATIKYMNGVQATYSLTAYSPYEGYRIAFNGTKGRIDLWVQERNKTFESDYEEIVLTENFGTPQFIRVVDGSGGHWGGDKVMLAQITRNLPDPMRQRASLRDGALAVLVGVAARKSCDSGQPVKIASLTEIVPVVRKQEAAKKKK